MSMLWPIITQTLRTPRRVAVVDDQRAYTYSEILGGAMFLAERIDATTSARHVGILLPTGGAFPMALLGAWIAGRVAVPLNYLLKPDELAYVIQDSGVDTILTAHPIMNLMRKGAGDRAFVPDGVSLLHLDDLSFDGLPPLRWPPVPGRDDLAVILYTSGTSGRPKGVMLTHGNFRANVDAAIEHANITQADTFLGVLPQFHSFGLTALTLIPLRAGSRVVYTVRFTPRRLVDLIVEHRPEIVMAVPSLYGALLKVKGATSDDFASVRMAISGGEPLPDATFEAFQERYGVRLLEGYGLTETTPVTNWCTPTRYRRYSVGQALPDVDVRVVDDKDRFLARNQDGEVLICGPNVMKGYYRLPEQTAEVFVDLPVEGGNGSMQTRRFFRTGDIGRIDDDGYLYITGRKKEMLIVGGENVFPREIEEVLNRHPSVGDSAVIGRNDGVRGEVPVAFVELAEDQQFDEPQLRTWCRDHLAGYKVPRDIVHIDKLPRNPMNKILRRELKAP
ncbi:MAG: long-chain fatty acid--CoA ligase [Phycisphaeraceae bacterium]|nr:long-chain fatty acid--CoA ligase [Phycisphaeraceae bacterium]